VTSFVGQRFPRQKYLRENSNVTTPETVEQYKARIAAHVKDKDPIEMQREAPGTLARLIEGVPAETLKQSPAPGKWSIATILAHLAEAEIATSWRYRQIIERSGTTLSAFDQEEWARLGDYESRDPQEALELFRVLREANLRMLTKLTPEEWQRFGNHVTLIQSLLQVQTFFSGKRLTVGSSRTGKEKSLT
jgi:hypothetical protein